MTDSTFLLSVLEDRRGEYVSHRDILAASFAERGYGLTIHSRASDLRRLGHVVDCRTASENGRMVSYYRLSSPLCEVESSDPAPKDDGPLQPGDSASQSGDDGSPAAPGVDRRSLTAKSEPDPLVPLSLFGTPQKSTAPDWA